MYAHNMFLHGIHMSFHAQNIKEIAGFRSDGAFIRLILIHAFVVYWDGASEHFLFHGYEQNVLNSASSYFL